MSQRLRVSDLKADSAFFGADLGLCLSNSSDNSRFYSYLNAAQERMQVYGRWYGSIQEAQFCVTERDGSQCLVFPREIATIEQVALCGYPISLQNSWYQYTQNLARIEPCSGNCSCGGDSCTTLGSGCGCGHLQMRMQAKPAASFDWTRGSNKVLRFYPTHSSDVGKFIYVQGYDENNIWVRTNPTGSEVIDGERVTLALPFVDTTTIWYPGSPLALYKDVTNYRVLMYEYDTTTTQERLLGEYQPGETNPEYRVAAIPHFNQVRCCDSTGTGDCTSTNRTVTALVKLNHIPLTSDRDWLLFRNLEAYREAMLAVFHWRNGNVQLGNYHFFGQIAPKQSRMSNQATLSRGGAIPLLRAELRSMTGDNTTAYQHIEATNSLPALLAGYR